MIKITPRLKLALLAGGAALGLSHTAATFSKVKQEIEETSRSIEQTKEIVAANERYIEALANRTGYYSEELEQALEETEKWLESLEVEEES